MLWTRSHLTSDGFDVRQDLVHNIHGI